MNDVFCGKDFEVYDADDKAKVELDISRNNEGEHIHVDHNLKSVDHAPE